ncbi:DNA polymerase IV [Desulfuromonas soudanensis]|uniref:DNA polymerase IV n=1 Tax=Desulfuromonas soudanensis TaxID=1603606 RepID=A0A0M4D415_9BACT|nr:DNA polymerase IV [Desulfuromonas soudanensis]ALC18290.1 DNA polymerase IV [Desulfuromonas soudanensis]
MGRAIIHLDMDAFFAAVEQRDFPELRGKPVIVGGSPERGVVCACSYEARPFGVRSAMGMSRALRLCPQALVRPVRMGRYREISLAVFAIFRRYTDRVEPLSIDEAFLDVTGCERLFGTPVEIAARIRREVREQLGLVVSAGIAPNKLLAKLASEQGKPDGLYAIREEEVESFLHPLPVGRLWGVGPVASRRLENGGIKTVGDLQSLSREYLERHFGSFGPTLFEMARGHDDREVVSGGTAQSLGHEETFDCDLWQPEDMERELLGIAERVARRLRRLGFSGRCITLRVKYSDHISVTRSHTLARGEESSGEIHRIAVELLQRTEAGSRAVRLLGITLSQLGQRGSGQESLFDEDDRRRRETLNRTLDGLQERFGEWGICRGSLLAPPGRREGGDGDQGS